MNATVPSGSTNTFFDRQKVESDKLVLQQLIADLNAVQQRLGTQKEQAGDCELARELGHKIRNKAHILVMLESLGLVELPSCLKHHVPNVRDSK
ncbi:MAG: hypothetical protein QM790_08785 [Nibricoccus sp.]